MGALGLVAGLWAEKFDQIAAFQNFVVMPMTFLSGVFYSVKSLPPVWLEASHLNPFFLAVRSTASGAASSAPATSRRRGAWRWSAPACSPPARFCLWLLRIGYKIRH